MPQLTKLQIIEETVEYYTSNPSRRSFDFEGDNKNIYVTCYLSPNGNMCAVGRCMVEPESVLRFNSWLASDINNLDNKLKPQYRGHNPNFWDRLQVFHDTRQFWDKNGLTKKGIEYLTELREMYKLG